MGCVLKFKYTSEVRQGENLDQFLFSLYLNYLKGYLYAYNGLGYVSMPTIKSF